MRFIKSFLVRINYLIPKKKKLPVWAHPYKDFFHNDKYIISYSMHYSQSTVKKVNVSFKIL